MSEATWSITTRSRAASSAAAAQSSANGRSRWSGPGRGERLDQLGEQLALPRHRPDPVVGLHHVVGGDALEHRHLDRVLLGHDEVGGVAQRTARGTPRTSPPGPPPQNRPIRSLVRFFSAASAAPAPVVRRRRASEPTARSRAERRVEAVVVGVGEVPVARRPPRPAGRVEPGQVDPAGDDAVLDVVDGVGDVVGEVHHLRLEALRAGPATPARSQSKTGRSSSYTPNLRTTRGEPSACTPVRRPRRRRAARGTSCRRRGVARVRLSPTERPSGPKVLASSRVSSRSVWALPSKPPQSGRGLGEHPLAVVAERRVAEVVGQGRGLGEVGLAAERPGQVAGDLGDLEAVGEPVADEVVALRPDHLGLGRQPTAAPRRARRARGRARTACARARAPAWAARLDPALARGVVVQRPGHPSRATASERRDAATVPGRGDGLVSRPTTCTWSKWLAVAEPRSANEPPALGGAHRRPDVLAPEDVVEVQLGGVRLQERRDRVAQRRRRWS